MVRCTKLLQRINCCVICTSRQHFKHQAEDFINAAKEIRIPETIQAFAEESVSKSREAFTKVAAATKDQAKMAEDILIATQAGAKAIGAKVLDNAVATTTAAFDAAEAIAKAKTLPEAARLQIEFAQRQLAMAGAQAKELFELSAEVAKQAFETTSAAARKSFEKTVKAR
jgi:hypothetical protein